MQSKVVSDTTRRRIILELDGYPVLAHDPYGFHDSPEKLFSPNTADIEIHNGEFSSIVLRGDAILKDGRISDRTTYRTGWRSSSISKAPDWVTQLIKIVEQVYRTG